MKLPMITISGKKGPEQEVALLDNAANPAIVSQAVRVYLSNQRAGTAKIKTRGEVDLTKTKAYKQKGTGRARHGAQSAPIFVGGGVAHGPHGNANWKLMMSKAMKPVALRTALSMQAKEGRVSLIEGLGDVTGKTSEMAKFFDTAGCKEKATLLIVASTHESAYRAVSNLKYVYVSRADALTTYYVMRAHNIFITPEAMEILEKKLASKNKTKRVVAKTVTKTKAKAVVKVEEKKKVVKKVVSKKEVVA